MDAVALKKAFSKQAESPGAIQALGASTSDEKMPINGIQLQSLVDMLLTKKAKDGTQSIQDGAQNSEGYQSICHGSEKKARLERALLLLWFPVVTGYSPAHWEWFEFDACDIEDVR